MSQFTKYMLAGFFLVLVFFQTGSATLHLWDQPACSETLADTHNQNLSADGEHCVVCEHLFLLKTAFDLPLALPVASAPQLAVIKYLVEHTENPTIPNTCSVSLRGPPAIG